MSDGPVTIRSAAGRLGMSQRDIAAAVEVSPAAVNKWWHGEAEPSRDIVGRLEAALEIPRGALSLAFGQLPVGTAEIIERDASGHLLVRVSGSSDPGWLKGMEPLFGDLVAA